MTERKGGIGTVVVLAVVVAALFVYTPLDLDITGMMTGDDDTGTLSVEATAKQWDWTAGNMFDTDNLKAYLTGGDVDPVVAEPAVTVQVVNSRETACQDVAATVTVSLAETAMDQKTVEWMTVAPGETTEKTVSFSSKLAPVWNALPDSPDIKLEEAPQEAVQYLLEHQNDPPWSASINRSVGSC